MATKVIIGKVLGGDGLNVEGKAGAGLKAPATEVLFGTGGGVGSDSSFQFDVIQKLLAISSSLTNGARSLQVASSQSEDSSNPQVGYFILQGGPTGAFDLGAAIVLQVRASLAIPVLPGGGSITSIVVLDIRTDPQVVAGVGSQIAVLVHDVSGATTNHAIKTGLGLVEFGDRLIAAAPNAAIADGTMPVSSWSAYLDEAGDKLVVKCKYANGTVKTGSIALV